MALGDRRERRKAEHREFGARGTATRYRLREKLVSFGDDYWIENDNGDRAYRVNGRALRLRHTLDLEDVHGNRLCRIQTRVLHVRDTMSVERPDGGRIATVHKALVSPLRERWKVDVEDGEDLAVQGNIVDHEYSIEKDGRKVAEISKRWFRFRDTYGVQIAPSVDTPLVLAVAVALDAMSHPGS
jgi:uncharacterized protein YxjI